MAGPSCSHTPTSPKASYVKAHVLCGIYSGGLHLLHQHGCEAPTWPIRTLNALGHADWFRDGHITQLLQSDSTVSLLFEL